MSEKNYVGIDYGLGLVNIDYKTGIRYGIISQHTLASWIWDYMEPEYGDPECHKCGGKLEHSVGNESKHYFCLNCFEEAHLDEDYEEMSRQSLEPFCYWEDDVLPDEPHSWVLNKDGYLAFYSEMGIMLEKSPYYTFSQFCSPCVPGAGNLDTYVEGGAKTYCFGHDFFEEGKAPYPVYRVEDSTLVQPEEENA